MQNPVACARHAARQKRIAAGQNFVEDNPQGKDVSASVGLLQKQSLRGHVGGCSHQHAGVAVADGGCLGGFGARQALGDPKVQNFHAPSGGQHDVIGFEVAMQDALFVSRHQPPDTLHGQFQEFANADGLFQPMAERCPRHVFHDQIGFTALLEHIINLGNVGVVQGGGAFSFLHEALAKTRVSTEMRRQSLQGHGALQPGIICEVNFTHRARAQEGTDHKSPHRLPRQVSGVQHTLLLLDSGLSHESTRVNEGS